MDTAEVLETEELARRVKRSREFADGLRQLADFVDAHPELDVPWAPEFHVFLYGEDVKEQLKDIVKKAGRVDKEINGSYYSLKKEFTGSVNIQYTAGREQVCTKRVVGFEDVPAKVIPAARKEIVEWECEPLLAPDVKGGEDGTDGLESQSGG